MQIETQSNAVFSNPWARRKKSLAIILWIAATGLLCWQLLARNLWKPTKVKWTKPDGKIPNSLCARVNPRTSNSWIKRIDDVISDELRKTRKICSNYHSGNWRNRCKSSAGFMQAVKRWGMLYPATDDLVDTSPYNYFWTNFNGTGYFLLNEFPNFASRIRWNEREGWWWTAVYRLQVKP